MTTCLDFSLLKWEALSQPGGCKSLGGCSVPLFPASDVQQRGTWLWDDHRSLPPVSAPSVMISE